MTELNKVELLTTYWGDYEKTKIYIGIPSSGYPKPDFVESLLNVQKKLVLDGFSVITKLHTTSMLSANRAQVIKDALSLEADYILWLDDDMQFSTKVWDYLWKGIQHPEVDIIAVNYPTRGAPHQFITRHKGRGDRVSTTVLSSGIVQVDFIGLGICLMKTHVVQNLSKPWFRMDEEYGEDVYLCDKIAEEKNIRPYISHDASKHLAHIAEKKVTYAEGRAKDQANVLMRAPTVEELFGELSHEDEVFDPLAHIK